MNGKEHPNNLTKSSATTSKIYPKLCKNHSWTQSFNTPGPFSQLDIQNDTKHTPNGPLEAPKSRPGAPRVVQRAPHNSTGAPQGVPRGSKRWPRAPPNAPKWCHMRPRGHPRKKTSEMLKNTLENH